MNFNRWFLYKIIKYVVFVSTYLIYLILDETTERQNRIILKDNLDKLLEKYNLGFKRPERLDVKKPGPPFDAQITESAQKGK